jgi:hypothetical protein
MAAQQQTRQPSDLQHHLPLLNMDLSWLRLIPAALQVAEKDFSIQYMDTWA